MSRTTPFNSSTTFDNEFDLIERKLDEIIIKETSSQDKCFVWDSKNSSKAYNSFVLSKNSRSKTICEIAFHKSSQTDKYIPRPTFKKISHDGDINSTRSKDKIIIKLSESDETIRFWKFVGFLFSFKNLVDIGEFENSFKVVDTDNYLLEFKDKKEYQKIEDLKELIGYSSLSYSQLKTLTFENRKKKLKVFFHLLKNINDIRKKYQVKYDLQMGEEYIWHHFLKNNDWIIGLSTDLKFIFALLDEQKIGIENTKGSESPTVDLLGISEFTTLIELKKSSTEIFKKTKSKGRANTWDFTADFIEGISQCLGQKNEIQNSFKNKNFINADNTRLQTDFVENIDPKSIFIIGNKKDEIPINKLENTNILKNNTLERFRRNNRNIDVITFDELFERSFHIVYSKKLNKDWYWEEEVSIFSE